jgi:two-component system alkaline phosphatase synthesis response regulator PhoP
MRQHRILIVEDERSLAKSVQAYLEEDGFITRVAPDGHSALKLFQAFDPNLVVLDIMLPELDGLEVLRRLRNESDVYVLMLTARAEETDKVIGLSMGADDYLTKPFSPRELTARVRAILRRSRNNYPTSKLVYRRLSIDQDARQVRKDDKAVDLTPIEFDILAALARYPQRVLSREQLIENVWGHDYYGDERVVDVHLGRLRKKIEDDPSNPELIVTVRSAGYRFEDQAI